MDGAGKSAKELLSIGLLEAIGTAILLIAVNFSDGNPAIIITGILTGAILSGRLTGAHFNPGVTLAVMIAEDSRKFRGNLKLAGVMILSQLIGGYVGQAYSYLELRE
jgi:glycerol uptake facilitator-like aquaporin